MSYSGIILAGGKSSRMGEDKALMEWDGTPMIQRTAQLLRGFSNEIIIASNDKDHHAFGDFGVVDNFPNSGPMAGVEAGLFAAQFSSSIVLSCDAPYVSNLVLETLISKNETDATIAKIQERIHPLIGIYQKTSLETIQNELKRNQFKMHRLLEQLDTIYVDFPASMKKAFININTPEEWNRAIEE